MDKKFKTAFVCTQCGAIHPKWQGQCRECGTWNSLAEERIVKSSKKIKKVAADKPRRLSAISLERFHGYHSGIAEFDRVLGGSLLPGCSLLLAGEPGIGKSTLILQAAESYSQAGIPVLYITGEESPAQIKVRADRLGLDGDKIDIINAVELEKILAVLEDNQYSIVIVDSIQTVACSYFDSAPGTVGQIREAAGRLIEKAKKDDIALFLIGHVTKEGVVAGPKVMEHMVDAVLHFEGDSGQMYRLLRPVKNRYGSTFELGVFEMTVSGLQPVDNPSTLFLSATPETARAGSVVAASCEGNRPILVEIQALVSAASYGTPQRVAGGFDGKRLALLLAILEKRGGVPMGSQDVFVSVAGGLRINEPALDLVVMTAIVSSLRDIPVAAGTVIAGELGLSGEVRAVSMAERRAAEAAKLGFERIILPEANLKGMDNTKIKLAGVTSLDNALDLIF